MHDPGPKGHVESRVDQDHGPAGAVQAEQAAFLREFANLGGYASPEQYLFGLDMMVAGFEAWARDHAAGA
jgi:hypothetical protein